MIIPITRNGNVIGTARVEEELDVEFYLRPGHTLRDDAKRDLIRQLKRLAKSVRR